MTWNETTEQPSNHKRAIDLKKMELPLNVSKKKKKKSSGLILNIYFLVRSRKLPNSSKLNIIVKFEKIHQFC